MELNEAERYAVAALWTLALHSTQLETGVDDANRPDDADDVAWGFPCEAFLDELLLGHLDLSRLDPEIPASLWGWDAVGPGGLCQRAYSYLGVPRKKWPALMRLPDVTGRRGPEAHNEQLLALVRRFAVLLDPELTYTLMGTGSMTKRSPSAQQHQHMEGAASTAGGDPTATEAAAEFEAMRDGCDVLPRDAEEGTVLPEATFVPAAHYEHAMTQKALMALHELVGACITSNTDDLVADLVASAVAASSEAQTPPAESAGTKGDDASSSGMRRDGGCSPKLVSAGDGTGDGTGDTTTPQNEEQQQQKEELTPSPRRQRPSSLPALAGVHFYDARARVAIKRVAHWLRVPWPEVRAFEQTWATEALELDPSSRPAYQASSKALKYLKIGAVTVAGGAVMAVTGGLAAPVIAAGLGAAVTLAGGTAAAAAAVSAAAASAGGIAATTTIVGAWGAGVSGASAADRYGDVKEFGFWDLSHPLYTDSNPVAAVADVDGGGLRPPTEDSKTGHRSGSDSGSSAGDGAGDAGVTGDPKTAVAAGPLQGATAESNVNDSIDVVGDDDLDSEDYEHFSALPSFVVKHREWSVSAAHLHSSSNSRPVDKQGSTSFSTLRNLSSIFVRPVRPLQPLLQIPVHPQSTEGASPALTIACNGCISRHEDFFEPWAALPRGDSDCFALVFEGEALKAMGTAVGAFITEQAVQQMAVNSIQALISAGLAGALSLPFNITTAISATIGSKWASALRRAQDAGKMLARLLVQGCHGDRPVTLIGIGMGGRVMFHALLELNRLAGEGVAARGLVESVVLLGTPVSCRPERWAAARSVVSGRIVSAYSVNDWSLQVLYRAHSTNSLYTAAAGCWRVGLPGIEDVNVSRIIKSANDYVTNLPAVLEAINFTGI